MEKSYFIGRGIDAPLDAFSHAASEMKILYWYQKT